MCYERIHTRGAGCKVAMAKIRTSLLAPFEAGHNNQLQSEWWPCVRHKWPERATFGKQCRSCGLESNAAAFEVGNRGEIRNRVPGSGNKRDLVEMEHVGVKRSDKCAGFVPGISRPPSINPPLAKGSHQPPSAFAGQLKQALAHDKQSVVMGREEALVLGHKFINYLGTLPLLWEAVLKQHNRGRDLYRRTNFWGKLQIENRMVLIEKRLHLDHPHDSQSFSVFGPERRVHW